MVSGRLFHFRKASLRKSMFRGSGERRRPGRDTIRRFRFVEEVPPARLRGNLGESDESKIWFRLMIPFTCEGGRCCDYVALRLGFNLVSYFWNASQASRRLRRKEGWRKPGGLEIASASEATSGENPEGWESPTGENPEGWK